ncbi:MAG TPA: hypothetical protein VK487_08210 [Candidatus Bathyarchaeia archaeon]|nr:hypothetical protein [Candidatus Bathyarchaeia archaeon]
MIIARIGSKLSNEMEVSSIYSCAVSVGWGIFIIGATIYSMINMHIKPREDRGLNAWVVYE